MNPRSGVVVALQVVLIIGGVALGVASNPLWFVVAGFWAATLPQRVQQMRVHQDSRSSA